MVTVLAAAPVGLASNFLPLILVLSAGCALHGKCCGETEKCYVCTMSVALFFFVLGLITQIELQYMEHPDCEEEARSWMTWRGGGLRARASRKSGRDRES